MNLNDIEQNSSTSSRIPGRFGKLIRFIFYISATTAALTYVVNNTTGLFEKLPRLKKSLSYVLFGPDYEYRYIQTPNYGVQDGGRGSQWKNSTQCLTPQSGGKLVVGQSQFIPVTRSADPVRAKWDAAPNPNPELSYCVTIATGTDDSDVYTFISGYIKGVEIVEIPYDAALCKAQAQGTAPSPK